jgi:hypothetical protein
MKAAALVLIAVALAAMAPAVKAANLTLCFVEVNVADFQLAVFGKVAVNTDKPISFRTTRDNQGFALAKFVVAWRPIDTGSPNGTVCSVTVDKKDSNLVNAWATARIVGFGFSPLRMTAPTTGSKTSGSAAKQYDFTVAGMEYNLGSGALGAKVNQQKPISSNFAVVYSGGQLLGKFGGANVTVDLKWVENKVPIKGCKLQLSSKTSQVIVKCGLVRLYQLSGTEAGGTADGNGTATLTNFKVVMGKSTQGAVDFSSAVKASLPDVA